MVTFTFEPQRFSWCTGEQNSGLSGIDKNKTRFGFRWKSLSVKFVSRVALKGNRFIIPGLTDGPGDHSQLLAGEVRRKNLDGLDVLIRLDASVGGRS